MVIPTDTIRLRRRRLGSSTEHPETIVTLGQKLDELFAYGFERDDVYALVIPLLMQGKVRLDIGNHSERLELEDPDLRQNRPAAVRLFEAYLADREHGLAAA